VDASIRRAEGASTVRDVFSDSSARRLVGNRQRINKQGIKNSGINFFIDTSLFILHLMKRPGKLCGFIQRFSPAFCLDLRMR
jgi:hypothetical protein